MSNRLRDPLNDFNITAYGLKYNDKFLLLLGVAGDTFDFVTEHVLAAEQQATDEAYDIAVQEFLEGLDSLIKLPLDDLLRRRVNRYIRHATMLSSSERGAIADDES